MSEKHRVVLDTQILLRAVVNKRSLPAKIVYDFKNVYTLLVSEATLAEIEKVLKRPKVRIKFELTDKMIKSLIERLAEGERIIVTDVPAIARDSKDDIFLACAVTGKANYIVSEDKDLLTLNPYEGIQIVHALDFLNIIQPKNDT